MEKLYSRQQLCAQANVPGDVLDFWMRHDLLADANAGSTRKHRRFTRREIMIAAFLMHARAAGLNVGALAAFMRNIRAGIALFDKVDPPGRWLGEVQNAVSWRLYEPHEGHPARPDESWTFIEDEDERLMAIQAADRLEAEVLARGRRIRSETFELYGIGSALARKGWGGLWLAYRVGEQWVFSAASSIEEGLPAPTVVAFDIDRIFAPFWGLDDKLESDAA